MTNFDGNARADISSSAEITPPPAKQVKDNDLVIFQTDKSGRFSVDSPTNYRESV